MAVLILVEHAGGTADDPSRQAVTLARGYAEAAGQPLEAVLFGPDAAGAAEGLGVLGVSAAYLVVHEGLTAFAPQAWGRAIAELVEAHAPVAGTAPGRARAPAAMARAAALGGAVGCSRAVTIAGWRPHTDQVGQTGTKIAPEIYIPCGISGATQHMAGCKGAKRILAINTDAEAPIVANADYAVIGDLHEVLPAITAEIEKARAG